MTDHELLQAMEQMIGQKAGTNQQRISSPRRRSKLRSEAE